MTIRRSPPLGALLLLGWATACPAAEGVTVVAPSGYCIERGTPARAGLVLMGRCAGVTDRPPAILTAVVGAPGSGTSLKGRGADLAAYFRSRPGRAALSRSGDPRRIEVIEAAGLGEAFLLRLRDSGGSPPRPEDSWRAVVALNGRLVTLTARGTKASPLLPENGGRLIRAFVSAMEAANRGPAQE